MSICCHSSELDGSHHLQPFGHDETGTVSFRTRQISNQNWPLNLSQQYWYLPWQKLPWKMSISSIPTNDSATNTYQYTQSSRYQTLPVQGSRTENIRDDTARTSYSIKYEHTRRQHFLPHPGFSVLPSSGAHLMEETRPVAMVTVCSRGWLSLVPRLFGGGGKKEPSVYCLRMRLIKI